MNNKLDPLITVKHSNDILFHIFFSSSKLILGVKNMDHNQEEIELIICLVLTFEITFLKHTQFTIWFQHKEIK